MLLTIIIAWFALSIPLALGLGFVLGTLSDKQRKGRYNITPFKIEKQTENSDYAQGVS